MSSSALPPESLSTSLSSHRSSLVNRVTARRKLLLNEGTSVVGTSPHHSCDVIPEWFDKAAYQHAQTLYQTFSPVIGISHLFGLLLGITQYPALAPLVASGQSTSLGSLFSRYLSTNVHIRQWFTGGCPFEVGSPAYQSLNIVRKLHLRVAHHLNHLTGGMRLVSIGSGETGSKDDNFHHQFKSTDRWMSQWSMAQAQFAFMGLPVVFPELLGFGMLTAYDHHCLLHFWRTIGHCLGIEDRFNLCTGSDDEEVVELCTQIYHLEWKPSILGAPEAAGLVMAQDIAQAVFRIVPIFSYRALMHYLAPTLGLASVAAYQLKTTSDYLYYRLLCFIMAANGRCLPVMRLASVWLALMERLALWARHLHRWTLDSQWGWWWWWWGPGNQEATSLPLDPRCPVMLGREQVGYRAAWEHQLS